MYPYDETLVRIELTGKELKKGKSPRYEKKCQRGWQ